MHNEVFKWFNRLSSWPNHLFLILLLSYLLLSAAVLYCAQRYFYIYLFIWFFKYGSMVDLRPVNLVSSLRTNDVTICGKWVWLERAMRTLTKIEIYCHFLPVVKRNSFFRCRQNNRVSLYGQLIQFDRCDLFIAVNWIACQINLKRIRY